MKTQDRRAANAMAIGRVGIAAADVGATAVAEVKIAEVKTGTARAEETGTGRAAVRTAAAEIKGITTIVRRRAGLPVTTAERTAALRSNKQ